MEQKLNTSTQSSNQKNMCRDFTKFLGIVNFAKIVQNIAVRNIHKFLTFLFVFVFFAIGLVTNSFFSRGLHQHSLSN